MITVVLAIHLMIAVALVGVILLQKSEGGALGMGGGGGMSGFMTGRSTANLLTRTTAALAVVFFATSIALAILAGGSRTSHSVLDQIPPAASQKAPVQKPAPAAPAKPAAPAGPSAPLAK